MSDAEILFVVFPALICILVIGDLFAHKYGTDMQVNFFVSVFGIGFAYLGVIGFIQALYG